ncbi:hypothetical protein [Novipirellula herctigrandis]|uniref:hypothetical protein n=1 Tax=Novipirellula herctigrandis TaxID=2527986 RepID=UPI003AF3AAA9
MRAWNLRVQRWSNAILRPDKIVMPPLPHEGIDTATQEKLDEIRQSWELTYDSLPRAADIRPRSLRRSLDRFPLLKPPIIHGLLRAGETMNVIAPPKVGKSWLASDMHWLWLLDVRGSVSTKPNRATCSSLTTNSTRRLRRTGSRQ